MLLYIVAPSTCSPGRVKCGNNNVCIVRHWLCDGDDDCGDNSDETPTFCAMTTCQPGKIYHVLGFSIHFL